MPISAVRRLGSRSSRSESGITLIELMVAITIIGVMFGVAASGLRRFTSANLKDSSSHLGAMLRYLSNKAVTDNVYLRVVYDLEGGNYWVEESSEKFLIQKESEGVKKGQKDEGDEAEEDHAKELFQKSDSKLLKSTKLLSGVRFKDVYVDYLGQKVEQSQAYTYFFPDGYATGTIIHLQEEEDADNVFSIALSALSGRVRVVSEYLEPQGS